MRGIPRFNTPMFDAAEKFLRSLGKWDVIVNPAANDRDWYPGIEDWSGFAAGNPLDCPEFDLRAAMRWNVAEVSHADAICLLPGWEQSVGTGHELYLAEAFGLEIHYLVVGQSAMGEDVLVLEQRMEHPPEIIGLMGYARTGKDEVGRALTEEFGFRRVSFADTIRAALYVLNPLVVVPAWTSTITVQQAVDAHGWEWAKSLPMVRQLLQRLGTDVGRNMLAEDLWVDAAFSRLKARDFGAVVITDVRFPNEVRAIRRMGGHVIRVERPGYGPLNKHSSETALDGVGADYTIVNDGTLADLAVGVEAALNRTRFADKGA
jgi:hypothetical protein